MKSCPKEDALILIRKMPEKATWEDILYELYVRKKIQGGIEAAEKGNVVSHEAVRKRFLR